MYGYGMGYGMMGGWGIFGSLMGLLVLAFLVLGIMAFVKYLWGDKGGNGKKPGE